MNNEYQRRQGARDDREIDTLDFLRETGGLTLEEYQNKLENQAENLRYLERRDALERETEARYEEEVARYEERAARYSRGYEDGYADALDEISERLAAEEEDEYDFGRRRKEKSRPKKKRVIYEEEPEQPVVVRRRKRRKHRFLRKLLLLLLVLIVLCVLAAMHLLSKVDHIDPVADTVADDHAKAMGVRLEQSPFVKNILLIGTDRRSTQEERQRSDTMILCSINVKTGKITLTSLMRDMYLPIPDYGSNKLNAAYALGDIALLDETIQENFGIDIDGNVLVDFDSFLSTLMSVGNIEMELTAEEAEYLNSGAWEDQGEGSMNDGSWNLQPGVNSLTPAQALAYCRTRYVGNSDWERTERQRRVIMAAFSKFKHSNPITQYRVMSGVLENVTTDMTNRNLMSALFRGILSARGDMQTYLIPVEGTYYADYIDDMAVLVPDLEQNRSYLREYVYG